MVNPLSNRTQTMLRQFVGRAYFFRKSAVCCWNECVGQDHVHLINAVGIITRAFHRINLSLQQFNGANDIHGVLLFLLVIGSGLVVLPISSHRQMLFLLVGRAIWRHLPLSCYHTSSLSKIHSVSERSFIHKYQHNNVFDEANSCSIVRGRRQQKTLHPIHPLRIIEQLGIRFSPR